MDNGDKNGETIEGEFEPYSDSMSDEEKQLWIRNLPQYEGIYESPMNISITKAKPIVLPPLEWVNFENVPRKTKVSNTGKTVIFSAKWNEERPYIQNGPFLGRYVFSTWHLHWGKNPMEGSEHTIDDVRYPLEMHVVLFKTNYLTQEAALKENDGCVTLVYLFKLQDAPNPHFQKIVDALPYIAQSGTSRKIDSPILTDLVRVFTVDYFMYWGTISASQCKHYILWLITRLPIKVSAEQIDALRYIFDDNGVNVRKNYRDIQDTYNRSLFHVCPSTSKYSTMLEDGNITHVYRCEVFYLNNEEKRKTFSNFGLQYVLEIIGQPDVKTKEKSNKNNNVNKCLLK